MKKKMLATVLACGMWTIGMFAEQASQLTFSTGLQDGVIQIIASRVAFNWTEPYRSPEVTEVVGSGFFIDREGHALTNYHVVEQCPENGLFIRIQSMGNYFLRAEVVAVCPDIDVAYLRVSEEGLEEMRKHVGEAHFFDLGNSDEVLPMDPIAAVGCPMGNRYVKITTGVCAGRDFVDQKSFLHITAPINPGNSGGPALDRHGRVIGINTALHANAPNIGYIIPINEVKTVLEKLQRGESCRRPKLGIMANLVTDEHAQLLGSPIGRGFFVSYVMSGSLGTHLGLQENDVITKFIINGEAYEVDNYGDVSVDWPSAKKIMTQELLNRIPEGAALDIEVWRDGKCIMLNGAYGVAEPVHTRFVHADLEPDEKDYELVGGLVVMQLRENHLLSVANARNLLQSLPEHSTEPMLIVTSVLQSSTFHKLRCMFPGMLLDTINGKSVRTLSELRKALSESFDSGYIRLRTTDPIETVVSWDKVLQDEVRLSGSLRYAITPFMQQLCVQQLAIAESQSGESPEE